MTPVDIADDRLGMLRFLPSWPGWAADIDHNGQSLHVVVETRDEALARTRLPRLRVAVDTLEPLSRAGIRFLVDGTSEGDVTEDDYAAAYADLTVTDVVLDDEGLLVIHFADECGEHFLDGYWPAVHYDAQDRPRDWSVEA